MYNASPGAIATIKAITVVSRCTVVGLICLLLVSARQVTAQTEAVPPYRLRLLGVFDEQTGNPIDGAKVSDVLGRTSTVTGKTGVVSLVFLPEGMSLVRLRKLGYEPQTLLVNISPSDTTPLTLTMRHVFELAAVVTTAFATTIQSRRLSGFKERERSHASGYFINEVTLEKSASRQLADLLRGRLPAVGIADIQGEPYLTASQRCRDGADHGPPQLYVDGVPAAPDWIPANDRPMPPPDQTPFSLTRFQVSDLAGIEWYPDNTMLPMEFSSMSKRCGVLLLWTKY